MTLAGGLATYSYESNVLLDVFDLWHWPSAAMSSSCAVFPVEQSVLVKSFIVPVQFALTLHPQAEQVSDTPVPTVCWCVKGAPGQLWLPLWKTQIA